MQLRYLASLCRQLLPHGIKILVVPLELSITAIKQLKIVFVVLLQVKKLQKQVYSDTGCGTRLMFDQEMDQAIDELVSTLFCAVTS